MKKTSVPLISFRNPTETSLSDSINAALALDAAARCSSSAAKSLEQQLAALTGREREVLSRILTGSTSKEIARELGVSPRTVEAHRQNLLRKMEIASVKELMLYLAPQGRGLRACRQLGAF